jgi:hypothetical protein
VPVVKDPYAGARLAHEDRTLRGPGKTTPALREAIGRLLEKDPSREIPDELRRLVEKIDKHAYRVTDEEIASLKSKYDDDQIFEIVVSAALGASKRRLDAGLRALEEA